MRCALYRQSKSRRGGRLSEQPRSRRNESVSYPLEYIAPQDRFKGNVPLSLAVKVGKHVFVSGIPGYDSNGAIAIGDFPAQMKQVMDNIGAILQASGTGWDRVARTKVYLMRAE